MFSFIVFCMESRFSALWNKYGNVFDKKKIGYVWIQKYISHTISIYRYELKSLCVIAETVHSHHNFMFRCRDGSIILAHVLSSLGNFANCLSLLVTELIFVARLCAGFTVSTAHVTHFQCYSVWSFGFHAIISGGVNWEMHYTSQTVPVVAT
jgi:hypothetical protein